MNRTTLDRFLAVFVRNVSLIRTAGLQSNIGLSIASWSVWMNDADGSWSVSWHSSMVAAGSHG